MARLVTSLCNLSVGDLPKKEAHKCLLNKWVAAMLLVFILATGTTSLAQPRHGLAEPLPPRPEKSYKPWPWFVAFVLLGFACYPAFKNSKRELSE